MKSHVHSRTLVNNIRAYYENHPQFSKSFCDRLDVWVEKNTVTGDHYVRSNLDELMANIVDLEDRYC
jgi:hypothetical protein